MSTQDFSFEILGIAGSGAMGRGIATPQDIDLGVMPGLGYAHRPLALGDRLGASTLLTILRNLHRVLGDPRYRPSPWLARRASLGLSLTHIEEL